MLELLGTQLLILAGLLTFWPRSAMRRERACAADGARARLPVRGARVLIVVVASPIVSIGGTRPVLLGLLIAALSSASCGWSGCRSAGARRGGLLGIALAGALPLAATADRGEPWFDYRSFAESLGPDDPVRFSWTQSYGPIDWPRDGNEVMRVMSDEPLYWKARNLDVFNGNAWQMREDIQDTRAAKSRSRPTCRRTGPTGPRGRANRVHHPPRPDARTLSARARSIEVARLLALGASGLLARHVGRAERAAPQRLLLRRACTSRSRRARARAGTLGERERQDGERTLIVPFQPGRASCAAGSVRPATGPSARPRSTSRPSTARARRRRPTRGVRRAEFDSIER